jgi:hypothetical protein
MEEEFLKVILEKKKSNGTGMTKDEAAEVIEALKKRQNKLEKIDSNMLRRLRNRKFSIEVINGDEVLHSDDKKCIMYEDMYAFLKRVHCDEMVHVGITKTDKFIKDQYSCVPREVIAAFKMKSSDFFRAERHASKKMQFTSATANRSSTANRSRQSKKSRRKNHRFLKKKNNIIVRC